MTKNEFMLLFRAFNTFHSTRAFWISETIRDKNRQKLKLFECEKKENYLVCVAEQHTNKKPNMHIHTYIKIKHKYVFVSLM